MGRGRAPTALEYEMIKNNERRERLAEINGMYRKNTRDRYLRDPRKPKTN